MIRKILLGIIWMAFLCSEAAAQCCSAGNPYFYNEQGALDSRELYLSAGYKNSISDRYYSASDKIYIEDIDKAWFNYLNLQAMYGMTKRVSLHADMGYFINKSEKYLKPDWLPKRGYGIGDLTLTMKYQAYNNQPAKFSVTPSVGIKLPVGVFDQEINKVKLPITLQPSSGSFRYNTNLFLEKGFSDPAYRLTFYGSFEYAQLIDSKNFYYKYGNLFLFSLSGSVKLLKNKIIPGLEIRNENRGRSRRENDRMIQSSGYQIIYAIPHLTFTAGNSWSISFNTEIPAYRRYNGIQLGNNVAFSVRISHLISLKRSSIM